MKFDRLLIVSISFIFLLKMPLQCEIKHWTLDPFMRIDTVNPIIEPNPETTFHCPIHNSEINWEIGHAFNPAAVVRKGAVYLLYRAEDDSGKGIGHHTSRIGIAKSYDGIHFQRAPTPVFFPDHDDQFDSEVPGGCEDPRIVETQDGHYVMTYTQWNRDIAVLAVATSKDLIHWKKHGYAFSKHHHRIWSKSGSIVCKIEGDHLIATKIHGKYWMYWGEGKIHLAVSDDLISWEPLKDANGDFSTIFTTREEKFDSALVEPGPPALLTKKGILLLYNGKNLEHDGDPEIIPKAYSAGQILFDSHDPTKILARSEDYFLTPERPFEMFGQYSGGTVFIEGLVHFKDKWFLYYGGADSNVGVAVSFTQLN